MPPTDLLTTTEAGAILGVTGDTMRRWAAEGRVRSVRLPSGQLRFERSDIDAIRVPAEPTTGTPEAAS